MTSSYQPYPRRLYLNGEVIEGDLHATNSVVVSGPEEEVDARGRGYRKAWEPASMQTGGNGGSSAPGFVPSDRDQGGVAATSTDPDLQELRRRAEQAGIKVDGRWKSARIAEELAKAGK